MAESPERLAEKLRAEGQKSLFFFDSLQPGQWDQVIYTEGTHWAVRQVLAHFVASEYAIGRLIEDILAGDPGSPEDFDLNAYNERRVAKLKDAGLQDLMKQFSEYRHANAERVSRLEQTDLARIGRHPFLGVAPLEDIIKLMYRHNQIHQRDIRRALASDPSS